MKVFPLKKKVLITNSKEDFLSDYSEYTEIPLLPHPGAFSCIRKYHKHEGIDLYANDGDPVVSIEDGIIIDIFAFTGEQVGTPWWNNTWGVLIEGLSGVINYGEIIPDKSLTIGKNIKAGEVVGTVKTVLTKDKGRPMSMLHLELYKKDTKKSLNSWSLEKEKPESLLDPTLLLLEIAYENNLINKSKIKVK